MLTERWKSYGKVAGCILALLIGALVPGDWNAWAAEDDQPVVQPRQVRPRPSRLRAAQPQAEDNRQVDQPGTAQPQTEENRQVDEAESVQPPADGEETGGLVSVDFNDVDLSVFIKFISEVTGRNFVIDEQVKGKITIISPSKISVEEAYQVFESVLEVHGYTTVKSGTITKIVKEMDARSKSIETGLMDGMDVPEDRVVTQLIPLRYANPDEIKQLFVPLISKAGVILSYPSTNMLIVTDFHSNIKRLMNILKVIDVTGIGRQVSVTPLEYSDAAKLVPILENVFQNKQDKRKPGEDGGVRMVADERSNAIVLLASEVETRQIKQLIALLDRKVPHGKEGIHVVYLKNADAEEMTEVLLNLPKGEEKAPPAGAKKTPVISKDVSITADSATNSLIIMAETDDFQVLREIIEQLDIPRSMVYIECLIVEVNINSDFNLGTEWVAGGRASYNDKDGAYLGGFGGASDTGYRNIAGMVVPNAAGMASLPAGFSVGAFGEAITVGGVMFPNVAAVIQAYKKNKDVHILSTPQIMTTDNTEATITIGKNIPYLTKIGTTATTETYSNYEYKDVGITLAIKPQINENRLIRMDISQEVTRLDQVSTITADRPATLKRTIKTNVIVNDQHTIVIGGLIDDGMTQVEYKVPCLGDIPLMGWLFKGISDSSDRTNLFVFLTPHVIKNMNEANAILQEKQADLDAVKSGGFNLFPATDQFPGDDTLAAPVFSQPAGQEPGIGGIPGENTTTDEKNGEGVSPEADASPDDVSEKEDGSSESGEEWGVIRNVFSDQGASSGGAPVSGDADSGGNDAGNAGEDPAASGNGEPPEAGVNVQGTVSTESNE